MSGVEVRLVKMRGGALVPVDKESEERINKIKVGETNSFKINKIRSPKLHGKYFALINLVFENQEKYDNKKAMRYALQMQAGYFDTIRSVKDNNVYVPRSIEYKKMDDIEFGELYSKVLNVILKYMMTGSTQEEVEGMILQYG